MTTLEFTPTLPKSSLHSLEELLFYNLGQEKVQRGITYAIERYGAPQVVVEGHSLRVLVKRCPDAESIFAIGRRKDVFHLAGAIVYAPTRPDTITVIHVAVHPQYASTGPFASEMLVPRLIMKVRDIARATPNLNYVELLYPTGKERKIAVRR